MCNLICFPGAGGWTERGRIMHNAGVVSKKAPHTRISADLVSVGKRLRTSVLCPSHSDLITICCLHPYPCWLRDLRHKEMTWHSILWTKTVWVKIKLCQLNQLCKMEQVSKTSLLSHRGILIFLLHGIIMRIQHDNKFKVLSTLPVTW